MLNIKVIDFTKDEKAAYLKVVKEGIDVFGGKGKVSIFHKVLIDRVANSYIEVQRCEGGDGGSKKLENARRQLQNWLKLVFSEINSTSRVEQVQRDFIQKCIEIIDDNISDDRLKKTIFRQLKSVLEEGG